ncbi:hypothetical protein NRB20_49840 [Nocardia sp. RB20]|uniref:Uncharacterized protein n=1 Tax=Nocardia macrotermitis TaxID=2585198 RepID=A0A7K0D8J9_9NOCA|nr:hypothetical protein [Nocardia macrotermitis]
MNAAGGLRFSYSGCHSSGRSAGVLREGIAHVFTPSTPPVSGGRFSAVLRCCFDRGHRVADRGIRRVRSWLRSRDSTCSSGAVPRMCLIEIFCGVAAFARRDLCFVVSIDCSARAGRAGPGASGDSPRFRNRLVRRRGACGPRLWPVWLGWAGAVRSSGCWLQICGRICCSGQHVGGAGCRYRGGVWDSGVRSKTLWKMSVAWLSGSGVAGVRW